MEEEDVFGRTDTHLGAVLEHLGVAEPVVPVVLGDDIGVDGDHAAIIEAVFETMEDGLGMEWRHRRQAGTGDVAKEDAVLDVAGVDMSWLQDPEQFRGQEIHLTPEMGVVVGVAEVVVACGVLVVIAEGDRGDDEPDAVGGRLLGLVDAIIVGDVEELAGFDPALHADRALQHRIQREPTEAVFPDDLGHPLHHAVMLGPLLIEDAPGPALGL